MIYSKCFPAWGPYGKKYMGLSRIAEHKFKSGIRFDFTVAPAIFGGDIKVPNVTVPSGCHPWLASGDYSFYSYRYDLEWKDKVYADVSYSKIDEESTLVRTEIVNNSELVQNCLINYFSSIEYPYTHYTRLVTPEKCTYKEATDYDEYIYNTPRPWDEENPDGLKKGEFRSSDFVNETGLGDRVGKWHMPHRVIKPFGYEKGDRVSYTLNVKEDYSEALLLIRYRTSDLHYEQGKMVGVNLIPGEEDAVFTINNDKTVTFIATDDLKIAAIPFGKINRGDLKLSLVSEGEGAIEFDFLCLVEKEDLGKVSVFKEKNDTTPEITEEKNSDGGYTAKLKYKNIDGEYTLRTFNDNTRFRKIETGALEDCLTARLSNSDVTFDDVLESFTETFSRKHSDEGFFHNTIVHTIFVGAGETHIEYAVISKNETRYLTEEEYEKIYLNRKEKALKFNYNKNGEKYELSNRILASTLMVNTVYPIYKHGENIIHHTPGKRWDCLYTWDSGFIGLGMAELSEEYAHYILDTYLSDESNPDYAFLHHGSPVPVQMYLYLELLKKNNNKENLLSLYPRAKLYYDFLAGKIRGSTTAKFKSGLTTTYDYFYSTSGMDDYPAQVEMMNKNLRDKAAPVISSAQLIRCAKILKMVALALGKIEDSAEYEKDIKRVGDALNKYSWDEESGYYSYVLHDENYEPTEIFRTATGENVNKGLDGIYPIIAGVCDDNRKKRIIDHLSNPKEMLSPYGISAVDMTAGYFMVNGYWNGHVWFPHQWFIWKTMLDMGESDFAYTIAKLALDIWKREVEYSYYTFEMVNVVTGRGGWFHNFGGLSAPINLWTAAYYKPGTFNTGFDVWVEKQAFSNDNKAFEAELKYYGNNDKFTVIVAMNDEKKDYKVTLNDQEISYTTRDESAIEVTINGKEANYKLTIK
ncbi:MAG: hypothetical protein IJN94_01890 [Clostridia bacterium]|nr:hypothetical protein [Clostridia bacterium]